MIEFKFKSSIDTCAAILYFLCFGLSFAIVPELTHDVSHEQFQLRFLHYISFFTFTSYLVCIGVWSALLTIFLFLYYFSICIIDRSFQANMHISLHIGAIILLIGQFCCLIISDLAFEIFKFDFVTPMYLALICFHLIKNLIPI